jgi:fibronectin-binding autotransporter adhesin
VTLSTTGTATIGVDDTRGKLTFGNLTATQIGSLVVNSNVSFGNLTGAANIVKSGNGTLEFTGTRSGAGSLTVNAGTLLINGGSSGTPGAVNINSGGTLAGNGTVGGAVNVASGGTFAPGNSPGTLTLNNNLTLASGSFSNFEVNGFTSGLFDLAMGGSGNQTVAFGGTLNVTFSGIVSSGAITIFDFENYSGNFSALNCIGLGGGLTADFDETTGVLTVVPEPSTTALVLGAGILGLLASRRRRMACLNEKVSVESSSSSMH